MPSAHVNNTEKCSKYGNYSSQKRPEFVTTYNMLIQPYLSIYIAKTQLTCRLDMYIHVSIGINTYSL